MKKTLLILCLIALIFSSCAKGGCPTTDKKYFTRGVPKSQSLYKGYSSTRGNKCWSKK